MKDQKNFDNAMNDLMKLKDQRTDKKYKISRNSFLYNIVTIFMVFTVIVGLVKIMLLLLGN